MVLTYVFEGSYLCGVNMGDLETGVRSEVAEVERTVQVGGDKRLLRKNADVVDPGITLI
jgi:hypothetical protein